MKSSPVPSLSPSFNTYSSGKLAESAATVVEEFRAESESEVDDLFGFKSEETLSDGAHSVQEKPEVREVNQNKEDEDDDFEFAFVCTEPDSSPISADEIFYNGQIRPIFPICNRDLLLGSDADNESSFSSKTPSPSIRLPLRKLLTEERDSPSCSSSEAEDLDGIPQGTYCVWTPKAAAEESPGRCKKSNSTGSSKRWKFRDLLHRSNSDGKDTFVFLTPSTANAKKADEKVEKATTEVSKVNIKSKSKGFAGGERVSVTAGHVGSHYLTNRAMKEGDPRTSLLPYRRDLVGFFSNVNGLSRNLHPF